MSWLCHCVNLTLLRLPTLQHASASAQRGRLFRAKMEGVDR